MVRNEGERLRQVVVCTPREEYARGASDLVKHNIGDIGQRPISPSSSTIVEGHTKEFGTEVLDLPELEDHPNSVFTRDTALCTPQGTSSSGWDWKLARVKAPGWQKRWMRSG